MKLRLPLVILLACNLALIGMVTGCKPKESAAIDIAAATKGLKSAESDARVSACSEIAKAGPGAASAVPDLIPLLKDQEPLVRRLAAYALGQIGPKASAAIPALKEAENDADDSVAQNANIALRTIDPSTAKPKQP